MTRDRMPSRALVRRVTEEFMLRLRDLLHFDSQDKEQRTPVYRLGESLYDICDLSGDGVLNAWEVHFCEYLVLSYAFSPQSQTEEDDAPLVASIEAFGGNRAQQLLRRFDVDTSGLLSPAEFSEAARMAFRAFGWSDDRLEDPRIAARIQAMRGGVCVCVCVGAFPLEPAARNADLLPAGAVSPDASLGVALLGALASVVPHPPKSFASVCRACLSPTRPRAPCLSLILAIYLASRTRHPHPQQVSKISPVMFCAE